jgi:hypothetical protein
MSGRSKKTVVRQHEDLVCLEKWETGSPLLCNGQRKFNGGGHFKVY